MSLTMLMMKRHLAQAWLALAMITGGTGATEPARLPPLAPQLTQADAFGGDLVARNQCLTIAMGPAAAAECGDLRLVHELPSVRRFNTVRTPTLIYSSAHAEPTPIVAVNVTLPSGSAGLNRVEAVLRVEGTPRARGVWRGNAWPGTSAARIALAYDAGADSTGSYRYVLDVTAHYGADSVRQSMAGRVAVVNRRASAFGAGWWLAGLEQLVMNDFGAPIGWVGGDGSYRRLTRVDAATWVAPSVDRPDTLKQDATSGARFVRRVSGGTRVLFDSLGRHVVTRNRLEHETKFSYDGTGRLSRIVLGPLDTIIPPRCEPEWGGFCLPGRIVGGAIYLFGYGRTGGLESISLSVPPELKVDSLRMVAVRASRGRIDAITDPDTTTVTFGYATTSSSRVASRTNRLGAVTVFRYDAAAKLTASRLDLSDSLGQVTDSIVTRLRTVESLGLAAAVDTVVAYTRLDGPRTDVGDTTLFWLDRHGAPRRIRDALGHDTHLARTDATFPALVMELVAANGLVTRATYDTRGNPTTVTVVRPYDDERDAVTTYAWNDTWDEVTQITQPEGEIIRMDYDPVNGNRLWQEDGRGTASRVNFHYYTTGRAAGLLRAIELPGGARDSLAYGAELGNLSLARTARGAETRYEEDAAGRPTVVRQQIDSGNVARWQDDSTMYDLAGRVRRQVSYGPAYNGITEQRLEVEHVRDAEGADTRVLRQSIPDTAGIGAITTQWRYDAAGRTIAEIAPDGAVENFDHDAAGNVTMLHTRRTDPATGTRLTISMEYDALNRVTVRRTPPVQYAATSDGIPSRFIPTGLGQNPPYPRYPNNGGSGYLISGDVATFDYDALGNMTMADNGDAQVRRHYHPGGQLSVETQRIRTTTGADFSQHEYELRYGYDRNGRLKTLGHPTRLAPSATQNATRYGYDPATGALASVTDALENVITLQRNLRGELESVALPGGITEVFGYALDGALATHVVHNGSASPYRSTEPFLRNTRFDYDARGKILRTLDTHGPRDTLTALFSGLGHLVGGGLISHGRGHMIDACWNTDFRMDRREAFRYDALGNQTQSENTTTIASRCGSSTPSNGQVYGYERGTGRLAWTQPYSGVQRDTTRYDAAGNTAVTTQAWYDDSPGTQARLQDRVAYYAADGTLRASDTRVVGNPAPNQFFGFFSTTFEEYRYDAVGRRVWVRARRYCENDPQQIPAECNLDKLRRTVWDGAQELYEIQMPGQDGSPHLENDVTPVVLPMDNTGNGQAVDPNPYYGRVGYTHALGVDRPLSVLRLGYGDQVNESNQVVPHRALAPFAILPLWSARGQADLGVFADGGLRRCEGSGTTARCVYIGWPGTWFAYSRPSLGRRFFWHGSVIEDKRDESGLHYRRARSYDPASGRFTQEDPIGLAGGMNLYGFANSDPVNFSDPFGLCPPESPWIPACDRPPVDVSFTTFLAISGVYGIARAAIGAGLKAIAGAAVDKTAVSVGERVSAIGLTKAETEATRAFFKSEGKELGSVTKDVLLKYRSAAERALSGEGGKRVTEKVLEEQTKRIRWIDEALKRM